MLNTLHMGPSAWTNPIRNHDQWWYIVIPIYIYIDIWYIYIYIYLSGERVWSPQYFRWLECAQCVYSWIRTLLGGLWNVHNFCDTCTTSVKRAQLLGNVHNTTSLKCAHMEYLRRLGGGGEIHYTHIYIYTTIYIPLYIYTPLYVYIPLYIYHYIHISIWWHIYICGVIYRYACIWWCVYIYGDIWWYKVLIRWYDDMWWYVMVCYDIKYDMIRYDNISYVLSMIYIYIYSIYIYMYSIYTLSPWYIMIPVFTVPRGWKRLKNPGDLDKAVVELCLNTRS